MNCSNVGPISVRGRRIGGVPVHLLSKAVRAASALAWHTVRGEVAAAFDRELWLCFFAGLARQRWADRFQSVADGPATVRAFTAARRAEAALEGERVDLVT
jgi:hypothetical protein